MNSDKSSSATGHADSDRVSPNPGPGYTRNLQDVIGAESERIRLRRDKAGVKVGAKGVPENLIGVSLSGGGVRSGATSLGFLMGLCERRLLKWVDYLSTVSGGGYAGALLTAEAAAETKARLGGKPGAQARQAPFFPLVQQSENDRDRAPNLARLRQLVAHSNYLIQNQGWLSRAALGVVLMGTVVFSTVICVMAFLAILFRSLYLPGSLDFLRTLGFEGDLIVPMTPAFACFLLWAVCWAMSFVRNRRHATGRNASLVFRAFLLCTVLGFTMIAVTGDIDAEKLLGRVGASSATWQEWAFLGGWLKSAVIALIGASLLPYFRPGALLRSGKERVAGPRKFLFVLARSGLLFGLPLMIFGVIARENVSNWQEVRDYRLEFKDLLPEEGGHEFGQSLKLVNALMAPNLAATSDKGRLQARLRELLWSAEMTREWRYFHECEVEYRLLNAGWSYPQEQQELSLLDPANEMTRLARFGQFAAWLAEGCGYGSNGSEFRRMLYWLHEQRCSQRRLMFLLNSRLLNPQIYRAVSDELKEIRGRSVSELAIRELAAPESESLRKAAYLDGVGAAVEAGRIFYAMKMDAVDGEAHLAQKEPSDSQSGSSLPKKISVWLSEGLTTRLDALKKAYAEAKNLQFKSEMFTAIHDLPASMQPLFYGFAEFPDVESPARADHEFVLSSILKINHQLVHAVFPDTLRPRTAEAEIFSAVVHTKDQAVRWIIFWTAFGSALVTSLLFDLNSISWHGFYAAQLSRFWVRAGYEKHDELRLDEIHDAQTAAPYQLINAAVSFPGQAPGDGKNPGENPDHFLLSQLYCGSDQHGLGFEGTADSFFSKLTLGDAIALSGAAVSPWATNNSLVRALLLVMNLRTGLWLPRPQPQSQALRQGVLGWLAQRFFTPLQWAWMRTMPDPTNGFVRRPATEWSHLLVTDGGHYENLGIEPLLRRRCRLILAVDATEDGNYEFDGLATMMNRARSRWGIEFRDCVEEKPVTFPTELVPDKSTGFGRNRFWAVRIRYPSVNGSAKSEGLLVYVKSVILEDDPMALCQHKKVSEAFPNDPTSDQFFDPELFESYRFLGFTAAIQLAEKLKVLGGTADDDLVQQCLKTFVETPQKKSEARKTWTSSISVNECVDQLISGINAYCGEDSEPDGTDPLPNIRKRLESLMADPDVNCQLGYHTIVDRAACLEALTHFLQKVQDANIRCLAEAVQKRLAGSSSGSPVVKVPAESPGGTVLKTSQRSTTKPKKTSSGRSKG